MTDLRHLRSFAVLAEELHFGRAAERLNIVQPALSMQIKALEEDLGTQLLIRAPRAVRLTRAGEVLHQEAVEILRRTRSALDMVRRAGQGEAGRLRIGVSASATASGGLAHIVRDFALHRPHVEVALQERHPVAQPQALLAGEIDLAFGLPGAFADHAHQVEAHWMARFPIELVVSTHHPLARYESVGPEELRDEVFIGLSEADELASAYLTRAALGFEPARMLGARSPGMMLTMVEANLGVAVVSAALRAEMRELRFLPIRDVPISFDLHMFRRRDETDPLVLGFWQHAVAG